MGKSTCGSIVRFFDKVTICSPFLCCLIPEGTQELVAKIYFAEEAAHAVTFCWPMSTVLSPASDTRASWNSDRDNRPRVRYAARLGEA